MDYKYSYIRKRLEFGRACIFTYEGPKIIYSLWPDKKFSKNYLLKTPVHKGTQDVHLLSLHEMNTSRPDFCDHGMFHDQGGWPKDLDVMDEEAVIRYKKKLLREENYVASMKKLTKTLEHAVLQNNAINIYETYFENNILEHSRSESLSLIRNEYGESKNFRPVTHLSWCPHESTHFAASYCNTQFQTQTTDWTDACLWNIEISKIPEVKFNSGIPIVALEWNNINYNILIGGLYSGDVAVYDIRRAPGHIAITPDVLRHRDPVHSLLWINSKTSSEFFSTSADGVVKWWDSRNLSKTLDSIILDLGKNQNLANARCASCLEYDTSIPARYMVGTDDGCVIAGNRKGFNLAEKLPWYMKTHSGPVYSIHRNQASTKNYLTVGDWSARIWSEECRESAIMWTKSYKVPLMAGEWSKGRYSVFIVARGDGYLDLWDVLQDQMFPMVSMKISDNSLSTLRFDDNGRFAIVGDIRGKTVLVQFGESLTVSDKYDKMNLTAMFDRETHREKILEIRNRELRYATKLKAEHAKVEETKGPDTKTIDEENIIQAEENYWEEIKKSLKAQGVEDAEEKKEEVLFQEKESVVSRDRGPTESKVLEKPDIKTEGEQKEPEKEKEKEKEPEKDKE